MCRRFFAVSRRPPLPQNGVLSLVLHRPAAHYWPGGFRSIPRKATAPLSRRIRSPEERVVRSAISVRLKGTSTYGSETPCTRTAVEAVQSAAAVVRSKVPMALIHFRTCSVLVFVSTSGEHVVRHGGDGLLIMLHGGVVERLDESVSGGNGPPLVVL